MLHFCLVDPGQVVFDRVLCGDDLDVRTVQIHQCRVQSGRLSRTGRASDQEDSIGALDDPIETGEIGFVEPEFLQVHQSCVLVENPHHHALAVDAGNDRYTKVDLSSLDLDLDPAVLRTPFFSHVHSRHDLQSRDHRAL